MALLGSHKQAAPAHILGPRLMVAFSALCLTLIGFVMIYSASSVSILSDASSAGTLSEANPAEYLIDQLKFAGIGLAAVFLLWNYFPVRVWRGPLVWLAWGIPLVLVVVTAFKGISALGAQRWLSLGAFSLQPSEFAKIGLILMAARIFYQFREGELGWRDALAWIAVLVVVPLGFIYFTQSDLGTTIIIAVGILAVMWIGEVPLRTIGIVVAVLAAFGAIAIFGTGYRSNRLVVYDPWNDGEGGYGSGYQTIHSFYAFAEGGLFGVGLGNSREKFDYLPEAETDFVFSIIGEELGLVGALFVIALFLVLLYAGLRIAGSARDNFGAMVAGSCTIMIVFQAFLNIGCVIGVLPTTGKPLPFVSSGGSSLIATLIMVGLILTVSKDAGSPSIYERRRADLRVVRASRPDPAPDAASRGRTPSKARR